MTTQGENGKLTASLVVLQILVFPNLPATIYFSESSNSCSMHSVQVYKSGIPERDGGHVITPPHLELELPKLMSYVFIF